MHNPHHLHDKNATHLLDWVTTRPHAVAPTHENRGPARWFQPLHWDHLATSTRGTWTNQAAEGDSYTCVPHEVRSMARDRQEVTNRRGTSDERHDTLLSDANVLVKYGMRL